MAVRQAGLFVRKSVSWGWTLLRSPLAQDMPGLDVLLQSEARSGSPAGCL